MTTTELLMLIKELIELSCTLILLIITGVSAIIAIFAYQAQRKSILITQWTTFKMLLEDKEQAYSRFVLQKAQKDDETTDVILEETFQRMQKRIIEIKRDINSLEKQLGLGK